MGTFRIDMREPGNDVRLTVNFNLLTVEEVLAVRDQIWFTGVDSKGKPIPKTRQLQSLSDTNRLYKGDPDTKKAIEEFISRIFCADNPITKEKFCNYLLSHDEFVDGFMRRYLEACQNDLFPGLVVG